MNNPISISHKVRGFTLVETLVAVAILMMAIAGPLTIASQALNSARSARNAMMATYLAQDGIESLRNIKDNNIARGATWTEGIDYGSCTSDTVACAIPETMTYLNNEILVTRSCSIVGDCLLHKKDITQAPSFYNTGEPTDGTTLPFKRYYYVSRTSDHEIKVIVVVSWTDGTIPNEIRLQSIMTDTIR